MLVPMYLLCVCVYVCVERRGDGEKADREGVS